MKLSLSDIKKNLTSTPEQIPAIEIFDTIDSTSAYLLRCIDDQKSIPRVCLAEAQTNGHGTQGRSWHSPAALNLYFSLLWSFEQTPNHAQGLSLLVGVVVVEALKKLNLGVSFQLKWPNDIFVNNEKLAGILVESRSKGSSLAQTVIGVGLNVNMDKQTSHPVSQAWTSLAALSGKPLDRNLIAAYLIDAFVQNFECYRDRGFGFFKTRFDQYDMTLNKPITVTHLDKTQQGIGKGIDDEGCLTFQTAQGEIQTIRSGRV